jgi:hypothetical protein
MLCRPSRSPTSRTVTGGVVFMAPHFNVEDTNALA